MPPQPILRIVQNGTNQYIKALWDGNAFTLREPAGPLTSVKSVSRVELLDSQGNLAAVIACEPVDDKSVWIDTTTVVDGTGSSVPISNLYLTLSCRCLLANDDPEERISLSLVLQSGSTTFSEVAVRVFKIAGADFGAEHLGYDEFLKQLTVVDGETRFKADAGASTPFTDISGISLFESKHCTVAVRTVSDEKDHWPALTFRRALANDRSQLSPAYPFAIEGDQIHAVQFPSPDWLAWKPTDPSKCASVDMWHVELSGFPRQSVADFWETDVRGAYQRGLRTLNDPLPVSLLPTLLSDSTQQTSAGPARDFLWRLTYAIWLDQTAKTRVFASRLMPYGWIAAEDKQAPQNLGYTALCKGLRDQDGKPLSSASAELYVSLEPNLVWQKLPDVFREAMKFRVLKMGTTQAVRLGAIDFQIVAPANEKDSYLEVTVGFEPDGTEKTFYPRVQLSGMLAVSRYGPGGQDPGRPNVPLTFPSSTSPKPKVPERAQPIVIDVAKANDAPVGDALYQLVISEWTTNGGVDGAQQQQVVLTVQAPKGVDGNPVEVLIIDPEPLLISRIVIPGEKQSASGATTIATWCNLFPEGPGWRVSAGAAGYYMLFPSQAVGETMVRGTGNQGEPQTGAPIGYRFSTLAQIWLQASYNAQNAVTPAWNTRELLGLNPAGPAGAKIDDTLGGIATELLYGMSAKVTRPNLRLADTLARLGDLPDSLPARNPDVKYTRQQSDSYDEDRDYSDGQQKQAMGRLGVLDVTDERLTADQVLDDGVQYTIRNNTDMVWPPNPNQPPPPPGFCGGLAWGIESHNVATELQQVPISVAGRMAGLRISALGGYGKQRGTFANKKVIIDTNTSMGRLQNLTVILVGRIGVLWNHALHVTVYERSTLPSEQFADQQDLFAGLPLLRKTSEYVEILEQTRAYPESGSAPMDRGFVLGSAFKSQRIPVDSRWGHDVGGTGWQVPLWQSWENERVYPKPHIGLTVAVDPDIGFSSLTSEVLDPQKLCFYTDTQLQTSSDTDTWAAVAEVDFVDQPLYSPGGAPSTDAMCGDAYVRTDNTPATDDAATAQVPLSMAPGFGRFTYSLAELPVQVNLVAARVADGAVNGTAQTANKVVASLSNVSMMRGAIDTAKAADAAFSKAGENVLSQSRRLQDWWGGMVDHLRALPRGATDLEAAIDTRLAQLDKACVGKLRDDLTRVGSGLDSMCSSVATRLDGNIDRSAETLQNVSKNILLTLPRDLRKSLNGVCTDGSTTLKADLKASSDHYFSVLEETLSLVTGGFSSLAAALQTYRVQISEWKKDVDAAKTAVDQVSSIDLAKIARDKLLPLQRKADAQSTSIRSQIDHATPAVERAARLITGPNGSKLVVRVANGLDATMDAFVQKLQDLQPGQPLPIRNELLTALSAELADLSSAIDTADSVLNQAQQTLLDSRSTLEAALDQLHEDANNRLEQVTATTQAEFMAALDKAFEDLRLNDLTTWKNQVDQWIAALMAWKPDAGKLCNALMQDFNTLQGQILDAVDKELKRTLKAIADDDAAVAAAVEAAARDVEAQISQVSHMAVEKWGSVVTTATGYVNGSPVMRMVRAWGEPPKVPNLSFDLPQAAYRFGALPQVDMTQLNATLKQAATGLARGANALSQLGITMPTAKIFDRLIPNPLTGIDFKKIFPNFAGLNLENLLSGVRLPALATDAIHIRNKAEPQSRRDVADVDVNLPLADSASLFDIGPVTMAVVNATFAAKVHLEAEIGQQMVQTSEGSITGEWQMRVGGTRLVSFMNTTLSFDQSGKLHFSIVPANVRLHDVMQFLADLLNKLNLGGGLTIHATAEPVRVQCGLELPLPDVSGGTFGIRNLRLGAGFAIGLDDDGFYMELSAWLARKTAPFTLTIFILGGSGWFETAFRYSGGKLTGSVTLGMGASASLAISLGPLSGSVSITFALFAELQFGGGGLSLGIMILIVGRVSVLGIIQANITLLLQAEYSSGGGLRGLGMVSISIKICWCFTLSVHQSVQYTFGGASGGQSSATRYFADTARTASPPPPMTYDDHQEAARKYLRMLS